jgi:hypothetical protein
MAKFSLNVTAPGVFIIPPETVGDPIARAPSHYLFQGLEVEYSGPGANYGGGISIGLGPDGSTKARQHWQAPHTIVVDRCWIHGVPYESWFNAHALIQGIRSDGRNIFIKDSLINELHMDPTDHGHGETHAVFSSNGAGPLYMFNNRVEAAIGSLTGGEAPWIAGLIHAGGFYFGNEYTQNPAHWHWRDWNPPDLDSSQPCYDGSHWESKAHSSTSYTCRGGAWQRTAEVRVKRDWHKNGWECKNCRLATAEGNYIHDLMDDTYSQGQHGTAFLLNHVDPPVGARWARFEHVRLLNNRVRRTGEGVVFSTYGGTAHFRDPNNIAVDNLLMENIAHPTVAPIGLDGPGGAQVVLDTAASSITVQNVTSIKAGTGGMSVRLGNINRDIIFRDNILTWSGTGFYANGAAGLYGQGCSQILPGLRGAVYFSHWALVDTASASPSWSLNYERCPDPKYRINSWAEVAFVDFKGGEGGDYRLCTGSTHGAGGCTGASPLAFVSSKRGPIGADMQRVEWATAGTTKGLADLGWWEFQLRRTHPNEIRYTSYDTASCSGSVKDKTGYEVHSWTDGGGANRDRTTIPQIVQAGLYTVRVTCTDGRWREQEMRVY